MNPNRFLKKSLMLMVMLLLFNTLIAQDRITFTLQNSFPVSNSVYGYFVIKATNGEQFTIDWGDSTIETKTGLGNTRISLSHSSYSESSDSGKYTVTITASNANCKFTYFDCSTHISDDVLTFQISSLTLEGCSDLKYLHCSHNSLQLSDLYAAHLIINEREGKLFGTQFLSYQPLRGGMTVDFSAQRIFGGVETVFSVWREERKGSMFKEAILNVDYTIDSGVINFINDGVYEVEMTNDAIISHLYPAIVVAGYDPTRHVGIFENAQSNTKIYPNPTGDIIYIETENETVPEVKIYSLDGRLLQQIRNKEIDLSTYSAGVYLLSIDGKTVKIIRE